MSANVLATEMYEVNLANYSQADSASPPKLLHLYLEKAAHVKIMTCKMYLLILFPFFSQLEDYHCFSMLIYPQKEPPVMS